MTTTADVLGVRLEDKAHGNEVCAVDDQQIARRVRLDCGHHPKAHPELVELRQASWELLNCVERVVDRELARQVK